MSDNIIEWTLEVEAFSGTITKYRDGKVQLRTYDRVNGADILFKPASVHLQQEQEQEQEYQEEMLKPVLHPGEEGYEKKNASYQDSARGYFLMPDGSKHRILRELAAMSKSDLREWKNHNLVTYRDMKNFERAMRYFKDPGYVEKERERSRAWYQNKKAAMAADA